MRTVADMLAGLDAWAPFDQAATWDPVGLQLGDPAQAVEQAAVCHEVTPAVVDAVLSDPAVGVLVTYHPLLFRPVGRLTPGPGPAGQSLRLLVNGVAVVAAHTNVDVAAGGSSDALASALGLDETRPFGPVEGTGRIKVVVFAPVAAASAVRAAMAEAGGGTIGLYESCSFEVGGTGRFIAGIGSDPAEGSVGSDNEVAELRLEMSAPAEREAEILDAIRRVHPYEEPAVDVYDIRDRAATVGRVGSLAEPMVLSDLARHVAAALGNPPIRFSAATDAAVSQVAVVPGAGADFAPAARGAGAEVLVTGDARHHAAVAAARTGLSIIDATHEATERPGMQSLYRSVASMLPTLDLTSLDTNPWIGL